MTDPTQQSLERARAYQLDDLVSRIWHVSVDAQFSYNDLSDDEMCGVDAAVIAQEACAKIKSLIEPYRDSVIEQTLAILKEHWLFGIECHHEAKTDQAICACGLKTPERENVGKAVQDWIEHLAVESAAVSKELNMEQEKLKALVDNTLRQALRLIVESCRHESGYTKVATIQKIAELALEEYADAALSQPGQPETPPTPDSLVFVPGHFRCTQCGFVLSKQTLHAPSGAIGITADNLLTEPCPNDGTMMVKVTWREHAEGLNEMLDKEIKDRVAREEASQPATGLSAEQVRYMVNRFLQWRLPENFNPDAGISFKATYNEHTAYPMKHEPVGTNLFDATQTEAMIRYLIDGMPLSTAQPPAPASGEPATAPADPEVASSIQFAHWLRRHIGGLSAGQLGDKLEKWRAAALLERGKAEGK